MNFSQDCHVTILNLIVSLNQEQLLHVTSEP